MEFKPFLKHIGQNNEYKVDFLWVTVAFLFDIKKINQNIEGVNP